MPETTATSVLIQALADCQEQRDATRQMALAMREQLTRAQAQLAEANETVAEHAATIEALRSAALPAMDDAEPAPPAEEG